MLQTKVTQLLGIKHPIVQGGMHYVAYAELAAAVSNAGGLGIITALTQPNANALREEIKKCRTLTDKPFGVNITLLPALVPPDYDSFAQVVIDEKIKIVETAGNNPGPYIKKFKEHGIIVIHKCVSIRHALTAERLGVDIISMDGFECAGHPGEDDIGNFVLLAKAAQSLKIPFIASGGVGTGRQLAASLALGAEGINMGTRFMATKECTIHQNIKQALVDGDEKSTTHIFRSFKNTERVYKNKTAEIVKNIEKEKPGDFQALRPYVSGTLYKDSFYKTGDTQSSVWSCGIVMGLINDIPTCQELMDRIVAEAVDVISKLPAYVKPKSKL
jgi:nitronate monooxygenase